MNLGIEKKICEIMIGKTRYSLLFTNFRGASLDNALFFCRFFIIFKHNRSSHLTAVIAGVD